MIRVVGYDSTNKDVVVLQPDSVVNALSIVDVEVYDFGNPFRVVRFDIYDVMGFVCRINVSC